MLYSRWAYTINQFNNKRFTPGRPKLNQLIHSIKNDLLLLGLELMN